MHLKRETGIHEKMDERSELYMVKSKALQPFIDHSYISSNIYNMVNQELTILSSNNKNLLKQ